LATSAKSQLVPDAEEERAYSEETLNSINKKIIV
jgi:hypothetical protein